MSVDRSKDPYYDVMFHGFDGRLERLKEVKRWASLKPMYYRTNLEDHSQMLVWVMQELLPYSLRAFDGFDLEKQREALTYALVHDDAEMITGDVELGKKYAASKKQLELWENDEERAIEELARQYPENINGVDYHQLLISAAKKDTPVSQFGSVCDKILGMGEALHELYAGNKRFFTGVTKDDNPVKSYLEKWFWKKEKAKNWYLMGPLFRLRHPWLNKPKLPDLKKIVESGSPHTEQSIKQPTGNPFYDKYKEVIIERGGQRGLELLVTQREFPKKE